MLADGSLLSSCIQVPYICDFVIATVSTWQNIMERQRLRVAYGLNLLVSHYAGLNSVTWPDLQEPGNGCVLMVRLNFDP